MTRDELKFDYFDWMYGLVCDTKYPKKCIDIIFRECIMEVQNYFYQRGV